MWGDIMVNTTSKKRRWGEWCVEVCVCMGVEGAVTSLSFCTECAYEDVIHYSLFFFVFFHGLPTIIIRSYYDRRQPVFFF